MAAPPIEARHFTALWNAARTLDGHIDAVIDRELARIYHEELLPAAARLCRRFEVMTGIDVTNGDRIHRGER